MLRTEHGLSERRACAAVGLERSVYHYEPRPNADEPIVKLLLELAWQRPEQGFGKLFRRLRRLGHGWNHKRVYRIGKSPGKSTSEGSEFGIQFTLLRVDDYKRFCSSKVIRSNHSNVDGALVELAFPAWSQVARPL